MISFKVLKRLYKKINRTLLRVAILLVIPLIGVLFLQQRTLIFKISSSNNDEITSHKWTPIQDSLSRIYSNLSNLLRYNLFLENSLHIFKENGEEILSVSLIYPETKDRIGVNEIKQVGEKLSDEAVRESVNKNFVGPIQFEFSNFPTIFDSDQDNEATLVYKGEAKLLQKLTVGSLSLTFLAGIILWFAFLKLCKTLKDFIARGQL